MTLKCNNCKFTADRSDWHNFKEDGQNITLCPICGQEDWEELVCKCAICGAPCECDYCDECKEYVKSQYDKFKETLTEAETEILEEYVL